MSNTTQPFKHVRMKDIADQLGISQTTVSRALQGDRGNISEETIARVNEVAREMGYDPSLAFAARRLRQQRGGPAVINHMVALIMSLRNIDEPYFGKLVKGISDALTGERFALVANIPVPLPPTSDLPYAFLRGDIDGLVVMSNPTYFGPSLHRLRTETPFGQRPVVSMLEPIATCACVRADDYQGGYEMTAHLLELGHRHIMHFYHDVQSGFPHQQRLQGCQQACMDRGLDPALYLHSVFGNGPMFGTAEQVLPKALRAHPETTAVLAENDGTAPMVVGALAKLGRRVPEEMSVVGFDDITPVLDEHGQNMLTTVRVPLMQIGHEAVILLIRRIIGDEPSAETALVIPTQLVERCSTAPPRSRA
jgi:DNA-binding LacI/PurR family transcriptional regulator